MNTNIVVNTNELASLKLNKTSTLNHHSKAKKKTDNSYAVVVVDVTSNEKKKKEKEDDGKPKQQHHHHPLSTSNTSCSCSMIRRNLNGHKTTKNKNECEDDDNDDDEVVKDVREKSVIIKLLHESFTNSLTQAIIKLLSTPYTLLKIYLFLNVFGAIAIASYMVLQSVMSYLTYEVITTSRTVYEKPTTFPKILICNQNMFQTEYAYDFINEVSTTQMNVSFDQIMEMSNFSQKWDLINRLNFVVNSLANDRLTYSDEKRRKLAHDLKDVLVYCSFGPDPCGPDDFSWSFDPVHGNCYR